MIKNYNEFKDAVKSFLKDKEKDSNHIYIVGPYGFVPEVDNFIEYDVNLDNGNTLSFRLTEDSMRIYDTYGKQLFVINSLDEFNKNKEQINKLFEGE